MRLGIFDIVVSHHHNRVTFTITDTNESRKRKQSPLEMMHSVYEAFQDYFPFELQKDYRKLLRITRLDLAMEYEGMTAEDVISLEPVLKLISTPPKSKGTVNSAGDNEAPTRYCNLNSSKIRTYLSDLKPRNTVTHSGECHVLKYEIQDNKPELSFKQLLEIAGTKNALESRYTIMLQKRMPFLKSKAPERDTIHRWMKELNIIDAEDAKKAIDSLYAFKTTKKSVHRPARESITREPLKLFWIYIYFLGKDKGMRLLKILHSKGTPVFFADDCDEKKYLRSLKKEWFRRFKERNREAPKSSIVLEDAYCSRMALHYCKVRKKEILGDRLLRQITNLPRGP